MSLEGYDFNSDGFQLFQLAEQMRKRAEEMGRYRPRGSTFPIPSDPDFEGYTPKKWLELEKAEERLMKLNPPRYTSLRDLPDKYQPVYKPEWDLIPCICHHEVAYKCPNYFCGACGQRGSHWTLMCPDVRRRVCRKCGVHGEHWQYQCPLNAVEDAFNAVEDATVSAPGSDTRCHRFGSGGLL